MTVADLPAVLELEARTSPRPWTAANLASCLAQGYPAWVSMVDGGGDAGPGEDAGGAETVVAYAILAILHDEGHLLNIAVDPAWRGQGHARHLLALVRRYAADHGCHTLLLEVRVSNEAARRLYEATGFATLGTRRRYYPNPDGSAEDALVCALPLDPPAPPTPDTPGVESEPGSKSGSRVAATSPAATPPPAR